MKKVEIQKNYKKMLKPYIKMDNKVIEFGELKLKNTNFTNIKDLFR